MVVVLVIGRTGDGKSALCKSLHTFLDPTQGQLPNPFEDSARVSSHTHAAVTSVVGGVEVVDLPGLLDTQSEQQDDANLRIIVDKARTYPKVHAFVLVVNEQAPRFDRGMQDAVKLLVDSFGAECLALMGVMFTRWMYKTPAEARETADGMAAIIAERTGQPAPRLPCWQYDAYPELLARLMTPAEEIERRRAASAGALGDMVRWARGQPGMATVDFRYGEYDTARREREAREAAQAERERREYEASVVSTETEERTVEVSTTKEAIVQQVTQTVGSDNDAGAVVAGAIGTVIGGPVFGAALGSLFGGGGPREVTNDRVTGHRVTRRMQMERRVVRTLGSGQRVHGDWEVVRQWEEHETS
jgi:energy-coupling factor transporter ATP-binding protein EcfA2